MADELQNQYEPDYVPPPGDILQEKLEEIGMSQAELGQRMRLSLESIGDIIQGRTVITSDVAAQLEQAVGIPARFWLNHEQWYRRHQAELEEEPHLSIQAD